jgi:sulfate adenylyltransferase
MNLIKAHWWELIQLEKNNNINTNFEIILNDEQIVDLHNISNGTYSPINWFLKKDDFLSVLVSMRLTNWIIWPIPIVLDISKIEKKEIEKQNINKILLIDSLWNKLAILTNIEIFNYSKDDYSKYIFWTTDKKHPWVKMVYKLKENLIGWDLILLNNIDINNNNYFSPKQTREIFISKWWQNIVAFQTRNPPHVSHEYLQKCALEWCNWLFINPVIWKKKSWDFKDEYILWAYNRLIKNYYKDESVHLWTLPLTMKYAWPREAILHAIIRQNFWCTHIIIGRDHAWVWDYYWTYDAQNIFNNFRDNDLEIKILKYENAWFCSICKTVTTNKTCPHPDEYKMHISWTEVRKRIKDKEILPWDFMRKEISEYLIEWKNQFVD